MSSKGKKQPKRIKKPKVRMRETRGPIQAGDWKILRWIDPSTNKENKLLIPVKSTANVAGVYVGAGEYPRIIATGALETTQVDQLALSVSNSLGKSIPPQDFTVSTHRHRNFCPHCGGKL